MYKKEIYVPNKLYIRATEGMSCEGEFVGHYGDVINLCPKRGRQKRFGRKVGEWGIKIKTWGFFQPKMK